MAHERIKPSFVFDEDKIKQLKQIAPECFEDGKINFETLRQNLGDWAQDEDDSTLEHFGLFWPGKQEARKMATIPPEGTLEPVYGEGLKADGTPDTDGHNDSKNIFIEGENLEVLKILQKSYAGKIKMIYIDPPYNTGNDFVYDDDFTEPLQEYLRRTGQIDGEGKPLTTNKKSDGRFHSKWLSMMYPRLRLARNLLKEDGVIFVSIDDNEVHNLKAIMNEIFGEENFTNDLIWQKKYSPQNDATYFSTMHDHILVFVKKAKSTSKDEGWKVNLLPRTEAQDKYYKYDDNDGRGRWRSGDVLVKSFSTSGVFPIVNPNTGIEHWPPKDSCYRFNKETAERLLKENRLYFGKDGKGAPQFKRFLSDVKQGIVPSSILFREDVGDNQEASKDIKQLFDVAPFDTPKPVKLIERLIHFGHAENEIILDFFGGSGTTAHATWQYSQENSKNLKFICVQIPEPLESRNVALNNWQHLAQISAERIKRASKKYYSKLPDKGFKYLKLTTSNYKKWDDTENQNISQLESSLKLFNNSPLKEEWNREKLQTELLLLEGFPLDTTKEKFKLGKNEIVKMESEMVTNTLLICLDKEIEKSLIEKLEIDSTTTFICFDAAISTQDKLQLSDRGLIKTI